MQFNQYIVDAFASRPFEGNPAAVCLLDHWLPDATLAAIAAENNQSETAFVVEAPGRHELRWFTPTFEIDLCGHATLASAFVVMRFVRPSLDTVAFSTRSGVLTVRRDGDLYRMDLPSRPGTPTEVPGLLAQGLGLQPTEVLMARDCLAIVESEDDVLRCKPDFDVLARLPSLGVIVSAPGRQHDFVSRAFFPTDSLKEDAVTGSAHCTLVPYWARRLGKTRLHARQLSQRGGDLLCEDLGERVGIAGSAVLFAEGVIHLPDSVA